MSKDGINIQLRTHLPDIGDTTSLSMDLPTDLSLCKETLSVLDIDRGLERFSLLEMERSWKMWHMD